jgi:probable phosphomutase (TIGR03848 family)
MSVPDVYLVRHGRSSANTSGVLAGRMSGVYLDERGAEQVALVGKRLSTVPLSAIVSSPLERTRQTAQAILDHRESTRARGLDIRIDDGFIECGYGDWTGQPLKDLAKRVLWKEIQNHPSSVRFPGEGGESLMEMQGRAVEAVRRWNDTVASNASYAVVSHGDVIKAILADALGMHLDHFQRIQIDPAAVSVIRYTRSRPYVLLMNDDGTGVERFRRTAKKRGSNATVGGGSGH